MTLVKSRRGCPPRAPPPTREGCRLGLVRWEALLLLRLSPLCGRLQKLTPVAPPRSGLRGGLHRKFVGKAVANEVTRLLAVETGNYLDGGLAFPAGWGARAFPPGVARPVRVWLRCLSASSTMRSTSTRWLRCLSARSKTSSGLSFQFPFMSSLISTLILNSGRCNPATNALLMTAAGPFLMFHALHGTRSQHSGSERTVPTGFCTL